MTDIDPLADEVVSLLRQSKRPFTLKELASSLNLGKNRIQRLLDELRALGYEFPESEKAA